MTVPFQLMLIYTMLDPIKLTLGSLLTVIGFPEKVVRVRLVQFAILMLGLFLLGPSLNIIGVTLAVDLMLLVGIILLLMQVKAYVDFSLPRLFAAPSFSLFLGLLVAALVAQWVDFSGVLWLQAVVKAGCFGLVYGVSLFAIERRSILEMVKFASSARHGPESDVEETA